MLYGRLVHVSETLTDLQILGCELYKMRLAAGLLPDPLGSYSALPDSLAVIYGGKCKERVWNSKEGREGREGVGGKGKGRIVID